MISGQESKIPQAVLHGPKKKKKREREFVHISWEDGPLEVSSRK